MVNHLYIGVQLHLMVTLSKLMVAKRESISKHVQNIHSIDMTILYSESVVTNDFVGVTDKRSGLSQISHYVVLSYGCGTLTSLIFFHDAFTNSRHCHALHTGTPSTIDEYEGH